MSTPTPKVKLGDVVCDVPYSIVGLVNVIEDGYFWAACAGPTGFKYDLVYRVMDDVIPLKELFHRWSLHKYREVLIEITK